MRRGARNLVGGRRANHGKIEGRMVVFPYSDGGYAVQIYLEPPTDYYVEYVSMEYNSSKDTVGEAAFVLYMWGATRFDPSENGIWGGFE